jgi:hypothetical protein
MNISSHLATAILAFLTFFMPVAAAAVYVHYGPWNVELLRLRHRIRYDDVTGDIADIELNDIDRERYV